MAVAENILNKQSRIADNGWSSSLRLDEGLTNSHLKSSFLRNITKDLGFKRVL